MTWRPLLVAIGWWAASANGAWAAGESTPEAEDGPASSHAASPALQSLLETAHALKSYPGLVEQSFQMYLALQTLLEVEGYASRGEIAFLEELARMEDQVEAPVLADTLKNLAARIIAAGTTTASGVLPPVDWDEATVGLELLLHAGLEEEYTALLRYLHSLPAGKKLYWNYEEERKNFAGEAARPQLMLWLAYPMEGPAPARTEIQFEIRREHPYDHGKVFRFLASRDHLIPALRKERTFHFYAGSTPETLQPVGDLTTNEPKGSWSTKLPSGAGWLMAVVEEADATGAKQPFPSPMVPLARGPNLIHNAAFAELMEHPPESDFGVPGWMGFKPGYWATRARGPHHGGAMQCELRTRHGETMLIGDRIPVQPGTTYFQTVWLRPLVGPADATVGRRYLDAEGNLLKQTNFPGYSSHNWRWHGQRLTPEAEAEADQIPAGTAFVEPTVQITEGTELAGLYLGVVEPPPVGDEGKPP